QRDSRVTLRWAVPEDGGAVAQLYNWYVTHSTATFQYDTVTAAQYEQFVADTLRTGPFLLAESADGRLLGYACAHPWHTRQAYAWDAETTIYCAPEAVGQGVGRRLYGALLAALRRQGYHNAFALVASPNPQSDAFHRAMGFTRFGLEAHTGYKFGQWLGLSYWQLALRREDDAPLPVRLTLTEAEKSEVLEEFF
ncbi:MAG: GNAT family N-acetyltransferase, partial [Gemmiger sp.]